MAKTHTILYQILILETGFWYYYLRILFSIHCRYFTFVAKIIVLIFLIYVYWYLIY